MWKQLDADLNDQQHTGSALSAADFSDGGLEKLSSVS